ncbi:TPA: 50S ribosomal protein L20 [bacterium]|nr:50S ribosomal protein L20 [bacterium]
MARVVTNVASRRRRKKIIKAAKGYYGTKHRQYIQAKEAIKRALVYAYRDRRARRRCFRRLWIARINAGARLNGLSYSRLINGLKRMGLDLNRKILAELAVTDKAVFSKLVQMAKESISTAA